jgi:hypothetical protein
MSFDKSFRIEQQFIGWLPEAVQVVEVMLTSYLLYRSVVEVP